MQEEKKISKQPGKQLDVDPRSIQIIDLDLPIRISAALRMAHLKTLGDFSSLLEIQQIHIRRLGKKGLEILRDLCDQYEIPRFDDLMSGLPYAIQLNLYYNRLTLEEFSNINKIRQKVRTGLSNTYLNVLRQYCYEKGFMSYEKLDMSIRACRVLDRANLSIEEFAAMSPEEQVAIKGAGRVTIAELRAYSDRKSDSLK